GAAPKAERSSGALPSRHVDRYEGWRVELGQRGGDCLDGARHRQWRAGHMDLDALDRVLLGVPVGANEAVIEAAWKAKRIAAHPDGEQDPAKRRALEELCKEIGQARSSHRQVAR